MYRQQDDPTSMLHAGNYMLLHLLRTGATSNTCGVRPVKRWSEMDDHVCNALQVADYSETLILNRYLILVLRATSTTQKKIGQLLRSVMLIVQIFKTKALILECSN